MAGMTEQERAIRESRAQVYDKMRVVMEKFDRGEALTVEDRKTFDDANAELTTLDNDLERHLTMRRVDEGHADLAQSRGQSVDQHMSAGDAEKQAWMHWVRNTPSYAITDPTVKRAYELMANGGSRFMDYAGQGSGEAVGAFRDFHNGLETRASAPLGTVGAAGVDGAAGFLIPQGFWDNLQIRLKAYGGLMNLVNTIKTDTGAPMPWPTTDPTGQLGIYLGENTALNGSSDDAIMFGQGMMHAWFISSDVILASLAIINDSAFDVDNFVTDRMAERIGRKVAAELWAGTGAVASHLTGLDVALVGYDQGNAVDGVVDAAPVGGYYTPADGETVFNLTNPTSGIQTSGNYLISWQSVINMISCVDPAYRQAGNCCFVMNDSTQSKIRSLTDGFGHPLWVPDVTVGPSDGPVARMEGFTVCIDQNTASVGADDGNAGGLVFGDFKRAMNLRVVNQAGTMRLSERYAEFLQIGYIGYVRMDSVPNDLHAVVEYCTGAT